MCSTSVLVQQHQLLLYTKKRIFLDMQYLLREVSNLSVEIYVVGLESMHKCSVWLFNFLAGKLVLWKLSCCLSLILWYIVSTSFVQFCIYLSSIVPPSFFMKINFDFIANISHHFHGLDTCLSFICRIFIFSKKKEGGGFQFGKSFLLVPQVKDISILRFMHSVSSWCLIYLDELC